MGATSSFRMHQTDIKDSRLRLWQQCVGRSRGLVFSRRRVFLPHRSWLNIPLREPLEQHPMDKHVAAADFAEKDAIGKTHGKKLGSSKMRNTSPQLLPFFLRGASRRSDFSMGRFLTD